MFVNWSWTILNWVDVFHSSEVEQTVLIFVFSMKFCIPHCCPASIPDPKILTFFRIRKVAHVQETFFDWQTHSAVWYWWLEPNPIYRIEFDEKLENIQPVCCTDKFHTQKRAHLRPVTLKKNISSSASLIVFRFWPKTTKYAYFKEPFLTHLILLKRVQRTRLIRTFCARNNITAF